METNNSRVMINENSVVEFIPYLTDDGVELYVPDKVSVKDIAREVLGGGATVERSVNSNLLLAHTGTPGSAERGRTLTAKLKNTGKRVGIITTDNKFNQEFGKRAACALIYLGGGYALVHGADTAAQDFSEPEAGVVETVDEDESFGDKGSNSLLSKLSDRVSCRVDPILFPPSFAMHEIHFKEFYQHTNAQGVVDSSYQRDGVNLAPVVSFLQLNLDIELALREQYDAKPEAASLPEGSSFLYSKTNLSLLSVFKIKSVENALRYDGEISTYEPGYSEILALSSEFGLAYRFKSGEDQNTSVRFNLLRFSAPDLTALIHPQISGLGWNAKLLFYPGVSIDRTSNGGNHFYIAVGYNFLGTGKAIDKHDTEHTITDSDGGIISKQNYNLTIYDRGPVARVGFIFGSL